MRPIPAMVFGSLFLFGAAAPARLEGVIRDVTGAAVPDAAVILRANLTRAEIGRVQTDSSGAYLFSEIPHGEYALQVQARGFMTVEVEGLRVQSADSKALPAIGLPLGYNCNEPVLRRLRVLETGSKGTLSGRVTDEKEKAIGGARIVLICEGKGPCANTSTDSEGRYVFADVSAGTYSIRLQAQGYFREDRKPLLAQAGYDAGYWPFPLQRCRGKGCESRPNKEKNREM